MTKGQIPGQLRTQRARPPERQSGMTKGRFRVKPGMTREQIPG